MLLRVVLCKLCNTYQIRGFGFECLRYQPRSMHARMCKGNNHIAYEEIIDYQCISENLEAMSLAESKRSRGDRYLPTGLRFRYPAGSSFRSGWDLLTSKANAKIIRAGGSVVI